MRAPPAAAKRTSGHLRFTARSAAATMALPTYMPMEPAMKAKSWPAQTTLSRPISPSATSIASSSPVFLRASRRRSGYFFWSLKPSGSVIGFGHRHLDEDAAVEERDEALARADRHVVAAVGADVEVVGELAVEEHGAAVVALDPQVLRHLAAREERVDLGADVVGDPVHPAGSRSAFERRSSV